MSDLIYRQDAIEAYSKRFKTVPMEYADTVVQFGIDLRELPSAHQKNIEAYAHDMGVSIEQAEKELQAPSAQRKGKWIDDALFTCVCSVCGIRQEIKAKFLFSYCPNCGADMRPDNAPLADDDSIYG